MDEVDSKRRTHLPRPPLCSDSVVTVVGDCTAHRDTCPLGRWTSQSLRSAAVGPSLLRDAPAPTPIRADPGCNATTVATVSLLWLLRRVARSARWDSSSQAGEQAMSRAADRVRTPTSPSHVLHRATVAVPRRACVGDASSLIGQPLAEMRPPSLGAPFRRVSGGRASTLSSSVGHETRHKPVQTRVSVRV